MLRYKIKKQKTNTKTTLEPTSTIGIKTESNDRRPMTVLVCIIVTAAVVCAAKMLIDSFLLLGFESAEPTHFYFDDYEVRNFYIRLVIGAAAITAANALHKHSVKAIVTLLAAYVFYGASHYEYIVNGFIRALNRAVFAIVTTEGSVPRQYYLTYFDTNEPKKELLCFIFIALFGFCFLLSYVGVRRCNALWFTVLLMSCAAVPLFFNCLDSEAWFIASALLCILMYTIDVQGYRRASRSNTITNFGTTLKISGKYAAWPTFQQTVIIFVCALAAIFVIDLGSDFDGYKRSPKAEELSKSIMYTIEDIVSGTSLDSFGLGTSNGLNNGQLSRMGDLDYSGKTMFEIKTPQKMSYYLRSYSAAIYTGKRWSPVPGRTYRSYDFWKGFEKDGFYPQFMHEENALFYFSDSGERDTIKLDIKNRNINHKTFLTDYRMLPDYTADALGMASYKYDGNFSFRTFGGEIRYNETIIDTSTAAATSEYIGQMPSGSVPECLYSIVHDGDFTSIGAMLSSYAPPQEESDEFYENEKLYRQFVAENYLSYPESVNDYLPEGYDDHILHMYNTAVSDAGYGAENGFFSVDRYYELVTGYVRNYLDEKADYTLTPGTTPSGRDFAEYFINENHQGYCVHFATAAALMLRRAGIPTRYCEGYFVSADDVDRANTGYDGFAKIPDSRGHAWVEAYYPLTGWQVLEFTPRYSDGMTPQENNLTDPDEDDSETDTQTDTESETDTETETDTQTDTDSETDTETDTDTQSDSDSQSDLSAAPASPGGGAAAKQTPLIVKLLLRLLRLILTLALIAAAWLGARLGVLRLRAYLFDREDTKKGALSMYFHSLRVLRLMNIRKKKGEGDEEFGMRCAKLLQEITPPEMRKFTHTALSARFGNTPPTKEQTAQMRRLLKKLTREMYASKPRWKKLIIKYILFFD